MSEEINPNHFNSFQLPDSLLEKIFELTGDADHNKGFMLTYVDQHGNPMVYTRCQNQIIEMGLRKAAEKYLISLEESDLMYGVENDDPENGVD